MAKARKPLAPKGRRRRVLVVESDQEFRAILCDFLAAQRFEFETAADGDECMAKLDRFKPDLLLLSRELPLPDGSRGPGGLRVLKMIKQDRMLRVPIIMIAEEASEADFERYRKLKFTAEDYVSKPFEDTEILRRIENLVGFDISDGIDSIQDHIDDAMDDPMARLFDADPEELGSSSATTRKEVARLLEQVGEELERQEAELAPDRQEDLPFDPAAGPETPDKEAPRLRSELLALRRQFDLAQKQLVSERKRSREIKKEWKQRLQAIEAELKKSEEREALMKEEFEKMRRRFADVELDHTMELERIQAEKRRLYDDLVRLQNLDYPPEQNAADLRQVTELIGRIQRRLEGK